jgi:hypothetical protein
MGQTLPSLGAQEVIDKFFGELPRMGEFVDGGHQSLVHSLTGRTKRMQVFFRELIIHQINNQLLIAQQIKSGHSVCTHDTIYRHSRKGHVFIGQANESASSVAKLKAVGLKRYTPP